MEERLQLALERIREIREEKRLAEPFQNYFERLAERLIFLEEEKKRLEEGKLQKASLEELGKQNRALFEELLPENYEHSYANPAKAVAELGEAYGKILSALYAETFSLTAYLYEGRLAAVVIRLELVLEIYGAFLEAAEEEPGQKEEIAKAAAGQDTKVVEVGTGLPFEEILKEIYFWFAHDYQEEILGGEVEAQFDPEKNWAGKLVDQADLKDLRYLYAYGEYISENELALAAYLNGLSEETIKKMADTYTEGYRRGFAATGKDISIKETVNVIYPLGMERMVKKAMENFNAMGLTPILYRAPVSFFAGRRLYKSGYHGGIANKQFEYDHEYDKTLYLNSKFINRKLEAYRQVLEGVKAETKVMGGPAVIESFGELPFAPKTKQENLRLGGKQQKLEVEYQTKASQLLNEYVNREERSFTIIAFPCPAIGEKFGEIFSETIRLNTLDNQLYTDCQQAIIEVLDKAEYVLVEGMGANETRLKVAMHPLEDITRQTNFENCVADVNIPVGEVFTSPRLAGTEGLLHVPRVFLNGVEYRNLRLIFKDGMIEEYSCDNGENPEEGKKLIKEKLLHHHDSLPMGEFAIGTNTTAYMMAKK
ncbi:MAG: aminopeptidase, partial [Lachnospiraceae bacterium]|nr:aminopeptidase [Lachnospiraceae bacterium]